MRAHCHARVPIVTLGPADSDEKKSPPHEDGGSPTSECPHDPILDRRRGEVYCELCGLVIESGIAHERFPSPLPEPGAVRSRGSWPVGAGGKPLRTEREWRDGEGRPIDAAKRRRFWRLAKVEWRYRRSRRRGRTTSTATALIAQVCRSLSLPEPSMAEAVFLYEQAASAGLVSGRSSRAVAAACLLAVTRSTPQPFGMREMSRLFETRPRKVRKALSIVCSELRLPRSLCDPRAYLPRLASALLLPPSVEREAAELLAEAQERDLLRSGSPLNWAAAALAIAAEGRISVGQVCEALGVSQTSVLRWRRALLKTQPADVPRREGKRKGRGRQDG